MVLQPHGHVDTGWGGLGHVLIGSQSLCPGSHFYQRYQSSGYHQQPRATAPSELPQCRPKAHVGARTLCETSPAETLTMPQSRGCHLRTPIRCRHMPPRAVHREFVPFGVPECAGQTVLKPQPHQEPHAPGQVRAPLGHSTMGRRSCPSLTPITDTGHKRVGTGPERRLGAGGSGMRLSRNL